jgi:predicted outer membrane protein
MRETQGLLFTMLLVVTACGGGDDDSEARTAEETAQMTADSAAASSTLTPVRAMSMASIEFGDMAAQRAGAPAVRQYAQTIAADHRALVAALDSVARLHAATLAETRETQELANTTRMAHSGLEGLAGADFDLPYVRAQVESSRMLVDRLDQQLIPMAAHPDLNGLLTDIRAMADAHLTRARQLLAEQLGETAAPAQPPSPSQPRPAPPAGEPVPPYD